jgi:hypothetical protein
VLYSKTVLDKDPGLGEPEHALLAPLLPRILA